MGQSYDPRATPWHIDESEFYEIEGEREQKEFLLRYAVLAPSSHNTQPWSFRIVDAGIEVNADLSRRCPVGDPADRELFISIGAAVTNLRVAAAHFGFESTALYGGPDSPELPLVLVTLRETCDPDPELRRLFGSVMRRQTIRSGFQDREIDPETLGKVCDVVESSELLRFVVPHERSRAAELVEEADRRLLADPNFREELAQWVRPNESNAEDGMSGDAFGIPGPLSALAPWLLRTLDLGEARGKSDRDAVEHAAGLIVLTSDDDRVSLVRAGEQLERLLLTLTSLQLQYAFVNQPLEVDELRRELWKVIRTARPPQLMLRIGYAEPAHPRHMPRRQVKSVVV